MSRQPPIGTQLNKKSGLVKGLELAYLFPSGTDNRVAPEFAGTLQNGATILNGVGASFGASGITDYLDVGFDQRLEPTEGALKYSFACRIFLTSYPDSAGAFISQIFGNEQTGAGEGYHVVRIGGGGDKLSFGWKEAGGFSNPSINGTIVVPLAKWFSVYVSIDGLNLKTYVDGVKDIDATMAFSINANDSNPYEIGGNYPNVGNEYRHLNGYIDYLYYWPNTFHDADVWAKSLHRNPYQIFQPQRYLIPLTGERVYVVQDGAATTVIITDVDGNETWLDGATGLVIAGSGFV